MSSGNNRRQKCDGREREKNVRCVGGAYRVICAFFCLHLFYVKPCSTNQHFSVGHCQHHRHSEQTRATETDRESFVLPTLFWIICNGRLSLFGLSAYETASQHRKRWKWWEFFSLASVMAVQSSLFLSFQNAMALDVNALAKWCTCVLHKRTHAEKLE